MLGPLLSSVTNPKRSHTAEKGTTLPRHLPKPEPAEVPPQKQLQTQWQLVSEAACT